MLDWKEELPNAPNVAQQRKASGVYRSLNIVQIKKWTHTMMVAMGGIKLKENIFFNGDF